MDLEAVKKELLKWLAELKLPSGSSAESWKNLVQEFPPQTAEKDLTSGLRVRLALPLCTKENRYLISIMECLEPDSQGVYIISAHVNWKADELMMQKLVDEGYHGRFNDLLKAKHTLWAQTFRPKGLPEALNSCAIAILTNELVARPESRLRVETIPHSQPPSPRFPKPVDEQG